jgi:hypothetical protein
MTSGWQPVEWAKLLAWLKAHPLRTTAGVLLVIAVILALFDRVAAGTLVAALFVVVTLFDFLPQMDSFAAFGIKAQWRKKLDEAEQILEQLKFQTFDAIASLNIKENKQSPTPMIDLLKQLQQGIDFRSLCQGRIPKADLPPQDAEILGKFADQVADIDEECRRSGRVTDEAIKLIDAHRSENGLLVLYRELFGREPPS